MIEAFVILRKYWWAGVIIALAFVVLFQRANIADKNTTIATRTAQVKDLTKSNEDAAQVIRRQTQTRIDNDAIADLIASKIHVNNVRETNYRTIVEKAGQNDKAVRDWLDTPVPDGVRRALQAH